MSIKRKPWNLILPEILAAAGASRFAEKLLQRSLAAALKAGDHSRLARIYSALAFIEERRGDLSQAAAFFKKAIETELESEFMGFHHCDLGFVYQSQGDYRAAARHFEEALRLLGSEVSQGYRDQIEAELRACHEQASR